MRKSVAKDKALTGKVMVIMMRVRHLIRTTRSLLKRKGNKKVDDSDSDLVWDEDDKGDEAPKPNFAMLHF